MNHSNEAWRATAASNDWQRVAALEEIATGSMFATSIDGQRVAVYRLDNGLVFATDNVCSHEFALLTDGWLEGCEVECPLHGGRFDVTTGAPTCEPADRPVATFEVDIREGGIFVRLPVR